MKHCLHSFWGEKIFNPECYIQSNYYAFVGKVKLPKGGDGEGLEEEKGRK